MNANPRLVVYMCMLLALVGLLSCAPARETAAPIASASQATARATTDQTATAAAKIIEVALSATRTPAPTSPPDVNATATAADQRLATALAATLTARPTATSTPDLATTQTAEAQRLATLVAATLTAAPSATPDLAATQTTQAQRMATAVAATLTARPTPTEDFAATQTTEANQLATAVAATLTAQPTAIAPISFPASLERIHFSQGSTIYTISTTLVPGIGKGYVLRVLAGQQMFITAENNVRLVVLDPDIQELAPATTSAGRWAFAIAQTGDHTLVVSGEGRVSLSLEIPPPQSAPSTSSAPQRIRFAAGSTSATFTVHLTENTAQAYILGVSAGQQLLMDVDRSLELRAFAPDGNELTSSSGELLKWQFTATQTGDYTIILQGTGDVMVTIYIPPL